MSVKWFAAALAALSLVAAAPPPRDWTRTAVRTAEGGISVGNPRAANRVVEIANYTCSHCAHFAENGGRTLSREIRAGRLAMEVRPFVNNIVGLSATIAARCAPERFWVVNDALYRTQDSWIRSAAAVAQEASFDPEHPDPAVLRAIAELGGIAKVALVNGVSKPRLAACYADRGQLGMILRTSAAAGRSIEGTPAFLINGQKYEGLDWTAFAAQLGLTPVQ